VAPPFHNVEKGDENDVAISCSIFATLFFCFVKQQTKFREKNFTKCREILLNFAKFCIFCDTKFRKINIQISQNTKGIISQN
jgi:hypothetical protein